uniref:Uncharacterized protein n=1 Tax=Arundo donax TaxID=35708 RepID=A0A0A8ZD53_ARUDO
MYIHPHSASHLLPHSVPSLPPTTTLASPGGGAPRRSGCSAW